MTATTFSFDERPPWTSRAATDARASASTCAVCGSTDVRSDAVERDAQASDAGASVLHLGECGHCEHRWTWRAKASDRSAARTGAAARPVRMKKRPATRREEVASAA